jgi:acetyltransferase-like isoleucine patch superfamily enzyme
MSYYRIRDYVSVLLYRLLAPAFGGFGRGVRIVWPLRIVGCRFVELSDRVTLHYGAYVAVLPGSTAAPRFSIGTGSVIGNHSHIIATRRIAIGTSVLIADRVYIADNRHGYEDPGRPVMEHALVQLADVNIGDGSWIGENVCIIGCSIGRHCVIGANSVVTRSVPDFCVAVGSPAVVVKRYCERTGSWLRTDAAGGFIEDGRA